MDTDTLIATADACLLAPYDLEARRLHLRQLRRPGQRLLLHLSR